MSEKEDRGWMYNLPITSWKLAAAIGSTAFISLSVVLHLIGWLSGNEYLIGKAIVGIFYAVAYLGAVYFLHQAEEVVKCPKRKKK